MKMKMKILTIVSLLVGLFALGAGIYEEISIPQAQHAINGSEIDYISPIIHIFMGLGFLTIAWASSWAYKQKT